MSNVFLQGGNKKKLSLLFGGQGTPPNDKMFAYYENFLKRVENDEDVVRLNEIATSIMCSDSGESFIKICYTNIRKQLDSTESAQPTILFLSYLQYLKSDFSNYYLDSCAGYSLGEYTALVVSESISFEDCMRLLKVRGEVMYEASQEQPTGMVSIVGLTYNQVAGILSRYPDCYFANEMFNTGFVLGGPKNRLSSLESEANRLSALKVVQLNVSGAFHTKYMNSAKDKLSEHLDRVQINNPKCKVYSNLDGKEYTDGEDIRNKLKNQLVNSVKWTTTLENIIKNKNDEYRDIGVGNNLFTMFGRVSMEERKKFHPSSGLKLPWNWWYYD